MKIEKKKRKLCKKLWDYIDENKNPIPAILLDVKINDKWDLEREIKWFINYVFNDWVRLYGLLYKKYSRDDFFLVIRYKGYEFYLKIKFILWEKCWKVNNLRLEEIRYWDIIFKKTSWKRQLSRIEKHSPPSYLFNEILSSFISSLNSIKNVNKEELLENLTQRLPYKD